MANPRRARKAAAHGERKDAFHEAVSHAIFEMEEPLREAQQLLHVIGAIDHDGGGDNEAVSLTAVVANRKLEVVDRHLHRIFKACQKLRV